MVTLPAKKPEEHNAITTTTRILVIGPAWVGDMVMAQSLFITLKQQEPTCRIDVVAPAWSIPLLQRMPQVDEAIELAVSHRQLKFWRRYQLGRRLHQRRYERAIILPRSFKSALIPFFAGAKQRSGYRGEQRYGLINDMHHLDKQQLAQTVQRYVGLAYTELKVAPSVPLPRLSVDESNQERLVSEFGLSLDKAVIGFMPGAEYGPAKQWPVNYYAELADKLTALEYQVWIFGSTKDASLGREIQRENPEVVNLCGKTALVDAVDLIALTQNNVTNDSGLMHVAAATDRPLVAIYGSSDPKYTPPLSEKAQIMYRQLACGPCFDRHCRFGHTQCLTDIRPDEVLEKLLND